MKKIPVFVLTIALCSIVFSCKKSYTCECRNKNNGGIGTTYTIDGLKKHAYEACSNTATGFPDTLCAIK